MYEYAGVAVVVLGTDSHNVRLSVLRRLEPDAPDAWNRQWLVVTVSVETGGYAGKAEAVLHAEELARFERQLARLHDVLAGTARLTSIHGWAEILCSGDGTGGLEVSGVVRDQPVAGKGNELHFRLGLDQSYLPSAIASLGEALLPFLVE